MTVRIGDWIQVFTGRAFYPTDPREDEIDIEDIAHALSRQCRYAGHIDQEHYSVAEHCVHISHALPDEYALSGLLHDAAEAYLVDVPRPIKRSLGGYVEFEERLEKVIFKRFGLPFPIPDKVKEYDNRILHDECRQLMKRPPQSWSLQGEPLGITIQCWSPNIAKFMFLLRFNELTDAAENAT